MRLLEKGVGVQLPEWVVEQTRAAGYCRMYYILGGKSVYADEMGCRPLHRGWLYLFPARKPYRITHDPADPINCLWLHLDLYPCDANTLVELDPAEAENVVLGCILKALEAELRTKRDEDVLRSLAEAFALCLERHPALRRMDAAAVAMLESIRSELFSPSLNVEALSLRFGYSPAHFIRVFRARFGMTPYSYITMLRMDAAARQLAKGVPVQQTAVLCGYADVKNFARAFKKAYGVPPSEYTRFYRPHA